MLQCSAVRLNWCSAYFSLPLVPRQTVTSVLKKVTEITPQKQVRVAYKECRHRQ